MRDHGATLAFAPRLPSRLARLAFRLLYRGRRLRVEVWPDSARYELLQGEALEINHHGEALMVAPGSPVTREVPAAPQRPAPKQPPGRTPPCGHRELPR
jgi:alpha,alpha-trehalose phosphorylase